MDFFLNQYPPALAATVAFELGVAVLLGYCGWSQLLRITAINCLTNPALHLVLLTFHRTQVLPLTWPVLLALEMAVFVAEWRLLVRFLRLTSRRAAWLSLAMNTVSALLGLLLAG